MHLRPATVADLDAAHALLSRVDLPVDGVQDQFPAGYTVAVNETELIGLAGIEVWGRYGLLRSVAVAPEAQGRGLGRALVEDRLAWARDRGLEAVYLLTTTAPAYFPRLGFVTVTRTDVPRELQASRQFADVCPSSATVMRLALSAAPTAAPR